MPELSDHEVRALAKAVNLDIKDSDIQDVRYSLNAMLEGMESINVEGINGIEPLPVIFHSGDYVL